MAIPLRRTENAALFRCAIVIYVLFLVLLGGQFERLNDLVQLVRFNRIEYVNPTSVGEYSASSEFQAYLAGVIALSGGLCYGIEYLCRKLSMGKM